MINYNLGPLTGSFCDILSIGIEEALKDDKAFQVYPNPSHTKISVHLISSLTAKLILRNYLGEIVLEKLVSDNEQLDLSSLSAGTYIGEFVIGQNVVRKKIVKDD